VNHLHENAKAYGACKLTFSPVRNLGGLVARVTNRTPWRYLNA
jgi:hypothetical protein